LNNEKMDAILNLSLETDEEQRMKSGILSEGYDQETGTWEVIVKYHGDGLAVIQGSESADILLNGYAIVRGTREQLEELVRQEQVEYMELPRGLQYDVYRAKQASCILPLTRGEDGLSGRGVLVAVIDSGIDYRLPDFRNENGSRIVYLWDQTIESDDGRPELFSVGTEYTKEEIDRQEVPSVDVSGHGTAVAGIAAGSSPVLLYRGVAPESELIIVKLRGGRQDAPLTTDLMRAITYVIRKALELNRPLVINLSIGDTYGSHDGTMLLERFIDSISETGRNVICIGAGNEASANGHTSFLLQAEERVELAVVQGEESINVQLWKNYVDECAVVLEAPNGERYSPDLQNRGRQEWNTGNTQVLIYVTPPKPFTVNELILFDFLPNGEYIDSGIWTFYVIPLKTLQHDYHMFLPGATVRNFGTRFLRPSPELTMTIPAFAKRALTVGAYDTVTNSYADFSGRGRVLGEEGRLFFATDGKPDIAAPGVGIRAPIPGGGYASFTGTSFATPLVAGTAALMMEWGIVRGNDPFLYGEKVKAYLRKGAKPLNGDAFYPNEKTGWGALCLQNIKFL